jgi:hypothetical protein
MKGPCQVIVGSSRKPLNDLCFFGIASKQDEVRVEALEVATFAPA